MTYLEKLISSMDLEEQREIKRYNLEYSNEEVEIKRDYKLYSSETKEFYSIKPFRNEEKFKEIKTEKENYFSNYDLEEQLETTHERRNSNGGAYLTFHKESAPYQPIDFEIWAGKILGDSYLQQLYQERINELKKELMKFQSGFSEEGFAQDYLPNWLKQSWKVVDRHSNGFKRMLQKDSEKPNEITQKEVMRYGLRLDIQLKNSHFGEHFRKKYFDTPFNFCLTYDGNLIASVGFVPKENGIQIEQVQGIMGNQKRLSPFKWERMLVRYIVGWAKKYDIQDISMISADNNKWVHREGHLDLEQGKMLYDVNAKRNGFKKGDDGNYYLTLKQAS